jgi:hypothetical protein
MESSPWMSTMWKQREGEDERPPRERQRCNCCICFSKHQGRSPCLEAVSLAAPPAGACSVGRGASHGADLADHGCDCCRQEEATTDAPMDR